MNVLAIRKSQSYLATVKRDLDQASRALVERKKQLAEAEERRDKARAKLPPEPPLGVFLSDAAAELRMEQSRPFFDAEDAIREATYEVRELERSVAKLSAIAEAPARLKSALASFRALIERQRELRIESEKNAKVQRTLEARIAAAKAKSEEARRAAVAKMVAAAGSLDVPEALTRALVEIQVAEEALADAAARGNALADELRGLTEQRREARDEYRYYSWLVADIELQEALAPLIPVLARAQVARRGVHLQTGGKAEIAIPRDAIVAAEKALASELPADVE